jgi:peroxiredoxin
MFNKMKLLATISIIFIATFAFSQAEKGSNTLVVIGDEVPQFKFEIEKGKKASISDFKGKVVMINFFATWCAPCRKELPMIQEEIWNKHNQNPKFAMLTFGREHIWSEVEKFKKEQNLKLPLLPDPSRKIFDLFASQTIPRTIVVGEDGKIIYMTEGFELKHFEELKKAIESKL